MLFYSFFFKKILCIPPGGGALMHPWKTNFSRGGCRRRGLFVITFVFCVAPVELNAAYIRFSGISHSVADKKQT